MGSLVGRVGQGGGRGSGLAGWKQNFKEGQGLFIFAVKYQRQEGCSDPQTENQNASGVGGDFILVARSEIMDKGKNDLPFIRGGEKGTWGPERKREHRTDGNAHEESLREGSDTKPTELLQGHLWGLGGRKWTS